MRVRLKRRATHPSARLQTAAVLAFLLVLAGCGGGGDDASSKSERSTPSPAAAESPTATPGGADPDRSPAREKYCDIVAELNAELDHQSRDVDLSAIDSPEFDRQNATIWSEFETRLTDAAPRELKTPLATIAQQHRIMLEDGDKEAFTEDYARAVLQVLRYHDAECAGSVR
jgi:hypothetical protein